MRPVVSPPANVFRASGSGYQASVIALSMGDLPAPVGPVIKNTPHRTERCLIKPHDMLPSERVKILESDCWESHG